MKNTAHKTPPSHSHGNFNNDSGLSPQPDFLPMNRQEMQSLGWDELDILLISGDAYVDHPSFGVPLLGRWLVAHGYRVGIIAQPHWDRPDSPQALSVMGRPRLFAGVSAGAIDSMLAHYTAFRKKRRDDAYTPGGQAGARPNRASLIYSNLLRRAFNDLPIVLGGIEASLRRCTHYDFWTSALRRPVLCDAKADLLIYGMGERAILEIAGRCQSACSAANAEFLGREPFAEAIKSNGGVLGTGFLGKAEDLPFVPEASQMPDPSAPEGSGKLEVLRLPSLEEIKAQPELLLKAALALEDQVHREKSWAFEPVDAAGKRLLILTPPSPALNTQELDLLYDLPFSRLPHPGYKAPIPAWEMIRTSITTHRGCGGGCSFCSLALHQGRGLASRSAQSILQEARIIAQGPGFARSALSISALPGLKTGQSNKAGKNSQVSRDAHVQQAKTPKWAGAISDAGGPSANMWQGVCASDKSKCKRRSCLFPKICAHFKVDQMKGVRLLREITGQPGVRSLRVASGLRLDLALTQPEALAAYTTEFTGGQLKIAPEHISDPVLRLMRKPPQAGFENFLQSFITHSRQAGKEQYIIPYLMSAFPGCTEKDMRDLKHWLAKKGWSPKQVQCFIPTPGTVATAMFFCHKDPDGKPIEVAESDAQRMRQHYLLLGETPGKGRERPEEWE